MTAASQVSLSFTVSQNLLKLMSIETVMPSNHLTLCHRLLLLPSNFPSIRVFSNESVLHITWPHYRSFSFSISPSNEYQGWFPLELTGLISLLSKELSRVFNTSWKASILWHSAFFMAQLSYLYMTTGKTIALTIRTFVTKVTSLLFNMLSRFVIAFFSFFCHSFLPRSKQLLISWVQALSTGILKPKKIVCHCFHCFPIYLPRSDGTGYHDLSFLNVEF